MIQIGTFVIGTRRLTNSGIEISGSCITINHRVEITTPFIPEHSNKHFCKLSSNTERDPFNQNFRKFRCNTSNSYTASSILNERETLFESDMARDLPDPSRSICPQEIFEPQPGNFGWMDINEDDSSISLREKLLGKVFQNPMHFLGKYGPGLLRRCTRSAPTLTIRSKCDTSYEPWSSMKCYRTL